MKLIVEVWRQAGPKAKGRFERHVMDGLEPSMSVLELLDRLNEELVAAGKPAVVFESDCREGICGACGIMINGRAHGPEKQTPACHQRLFKFPDGSNVRLAPMETGAFPVLRDLMVDRSALDRVIAAGAYVSTNAGTAPDADVIRTGHGTVEFALDMAACIGCGACVAACPNGAAHLFVGSKLAHLAALPVGEEERVQRARAMTEAADGEFGPCSMFGECAEVCPAEIPLSTVATVAHERWRAGILRGF